MNISIFSKVDADIAFIARCLPAHTCHGIGQRTEIRRAHPALLIVDVATAGAHLTEIIDIAQTQLPPVPVLLLSGDAPEELAQLSDNLDTEFKPLRRHAVAARVKVMLQRVYPEQSAPEIRQFGDYAFEAAVCTATHAGRRIVLTEKEFRLALLLFDHQGRPLSRAYLQETIWGPEEDNAAPTRTMDTHISRVRNKLKLRPENGFRLSTVYGYGYQLERLDAPAEK